jgi:hypothetical protein
MTKFESSVDIKWNWIDRGNWGIPAPCKGLPRIKPIMLKPFNNRLDVESAKKYFLVPFKEQESLYFIGGKKRLLALEMVMDAKDVIATTGVNTETCYILVNRDGKECEELLKQMNEVMRNATNKERDKTNKEVH